MWTMRRQHGASASGAGVAARRSDGTRNAAPERRDPEQAPKIRRRAAKGYAKSTHAVFAECKRRAIIGSGSSPRWAPTVRVLTAAKEGASGWIGRPAGMGRPRPRGFLEKRGSSSSMISPFRQHLRHLEAELSFPPQGKGDARDAGHEDAEANVEIEFLVGDQPH